MATQIIFLALHYAIKVITKAWSMRTAPSAFGGGKKVNGDVLLRPKHMIIPMDLGITIAELMEWKTS